MLFYVYGTDAYLCREKIEELKNSFIEKKDKAGLNVVKLSADNLDFDRFCQEILTVPFLSEKKLIMIEDLISDQPAGRKKLNDQIFEFLKTKEKSLENNLLLVDIFEDEKKLPKKNDLFNYLLKQQYVWFLPALRNSQLAAWLKKYSAVKKINLSAPALNELIALVGNDLLQLKNELGKLSAFKAGEIITPEDVRLLVKAKYDNDIFRLTDALANKNKQLAIELISQQLQAGNEPLSLLGSINWQFKTMLKIKSLLEKNPRETAASISSQTGFHSYVVSKNLATIKKFSLADLISISNQLLEIEKQLKSAGQKNAELLFDLFVAKNC